jgi:hypothetical protein
MLLSPRAIDEVLAIVAPRDFHRPAHKLIAECIAGMHAAAKRVDAVTVADELLKRLKLTKTGGAPYLHTLIASVTTPASASYYAEIVHEYADRRHLAEIAARIEQDVRQGISPADVAARAQRDLESLTCGPDQSAAESTTLRGIPAYPGDDLCGPLADLVSSSTLPAALVAGAGLGALAGICGNADLVMPDEALVRPALWIALVAQRGAGKSPSMDKAFGKLRELDAKAHDQYRTQLEDYLGMPTKVRAGAEMPRDTTRRIDDITLEAVARFLDSGDATGVVESDELSGWLESIGQYKRGGGDKGRWLAMWSAQPWRYQRVGGDKSGAVGIDFYIQRPVLSIVGGIQPHLHNLLGDADSGFRPRWLPHYAPLQTLTWGPRIHEPANWDKSVEELYGLSKRRQWELTGQALRIWQQHCAAWKAQARGSENAAASAALDKSDIQSARIALVIAESMNPGAGGEIPADAMRCAVAITEFVMNCWRTLPGQEAFALSRREEILASKVDELANWLESRKDRKATRTQIKESTVAGVRTANDVTTLLTAYEKVYPGTVVTEQPPGRGRPGQVVYAPIRESLNVIAPTSLYFGGLTERSENYGIGEGNHDGAKPQVDDSMGFTEHRLGKSMLGKSALGDSATARNHSGMCTVCGAPLPSSLTAVGQTIHPTCEARRVGGNA